ncbi:hypothetical protein Aspvir_008600 [Aspergillus viridinutans]|uniref:Uncharacterized protein n=1 Tax=Aspergillus viridinutans TaxID=75553 RepID=A0A9P3C2L8_ASPVI|nr:uncharacterized protein Aspvir_008600 [Aspergillus viridinutans]GIK04517.1 hypothetical protein Aspvir_008600 [Aspergillus viridinutans]
MAKSIKTMDIRFCHPADKKRKWHKDGKPLRSLTYAPWFEYEFMDHQIVCLPFCRLHNVSSKKLRYSKKWGLDWTIPARAGVCFRRDGGWTIDEFDDIDLFFSKLNDCFVDRVEKGLPGEVARALRHQLEQWTKAGMQKDAFKFDILCSRKWYRDRHSVSSPFMTFSPDDDEFTTSGKNSPHDLGIAGDDTGNPPAPLKEAAEMPLSEHDAAKKALHRADLANQPCTLTLAQTRAVLDCLRRESQASASGSLTSTKDSTARLEFLVLLGDYAGRLWKCLRKASVALKDELPDRVGAFYERLIVEGKYGRGAYADTLLACVNYLRESGMDVDEETARLAIQIYTERHEACHTAGNPNIAGDLQELGSLKRRVYMPLMASSKT